MSASAGQAGPTAPALPVVPAAELGRMSTEPRRMGTGPRSPGRRQGRLHPLLFVALLAQLPLMSAANAQLTAPRKLSTTVDPMATLQEQLVNRLRAFDPDQRRYIEMVVKKVREGELSTRLVQAVHIYAVRRNPHFPFPFFERALRVEAGKLGVALPTVRQYASTRDGRR